MQVITSFPLQFQKTSSNSLLSQTFIETHNQIKSNLHKMIFLFIFVALFSNSYGFKDKPIESTFFRIGSVTNGADFIHFHHVIDYETFRSEQQKFTENIQNHIKNLKKSGYEEKFNLIEKLLGRSNQEMDEIHTWFTAPKSHRKPRQAMAVLAGIFSVGLSIYDAIEIEALKSQVYNIQNRQTVLERNQEKLIHSIRNVDHALGKINQNIRVLKRVALELIQREATHEELNNLIHALQNRLNDIRFFKDVVLELLHGRLDPRLVTLPELQHELMVAGDYAKTKGYKLFETDLSDFYRSPISYIANSSHVDIFIHIPMIKEGHFQLYRYLPVPVNVSGVPLIVQDPFDHDLIALNPSKKHGFTMSTSQLTKCSFNPTLNLYLCPDSLLIDQDVSLECLGSLFYGVVSTLEDKCQVSIAAKSFMARDVAEQITRRDVFMRSEKAQTAVLTCDKRVSKQTIKPGAHLLTIPESCSLQVGRFHLEKSKTDVNLGQIQLVPIPHIDEVLRTMKMSSMEDELRRIAAPSVEPPPELEKVPAETMNYFSLVHLFITLILAVAVVVLVGLRFKRGPPDQTGPPGPTPKQMIHPAWMEPPKALVHERFVGHDDNKKEEDENQEGLSGRLPSLRK